MFSLVPHLYTQDAEDDEKGTTDEDDVSDRTKG